MESSYQIPKTLFSTFRARREGGHERWRRCMPAGLALVPILVCPKITIKSPPEQTKPKHCSRQKNNCWIQFSHYTPLLPLPGGSLDHAGRYCRNPPHSLLKAHDWRTARRIVSTRHASPLRAGRTCRRVPRPGSGLRLKVLWVLVVRVYPCFYPFNCPSEFLLTFVQGHQATGAVW